MPRLVARAYDWRVSEPAKNTKGLSQPPLGGVQRPGKSEPSSGFVACSKPANHDKSNRFSLHNLSAAFARLTGVSQPVAPPPQVAEALEQGQEEEVPESAGSDALSPQMIVEGMLFVGNNDGRPLTSA